MKERSVRVMGFGTFDGLHPGHLFFIDQLKALGDELVLVVARDVNVQKIKGKTPKWKEDERLQALRRVKGVNEAILGNEHDFYQCIRDHKPNVIGLGYDQRADLERLQQEFPDIELVRLEAYEPEKYKSSLLNY